MWLIASWPHWCCSVKTQGVLLWIPCVQKTRPLWWNQISERPQTTSAAVTLVWVSAFLWLPLVWHTWPDFKWESSNCHDRRMQLRHRSSYSTFACSAQLLVAMSRQLSLPLLTGFDYRSYTSCIQSSYCMHSVSHLRGTLENIWSSTACSKLLRITRCICVGEVFE